MGRRLWRRPALWPAFEPLPCAYGANASFAPPRRREHLHLPPQREPRSRAGSMVGMDALHGLIANASSPPGRAGRGGIGKRLVNRSSWKVRNAPARIARSIQTDYQVLLCAYYVPSFSSHAPRPTPVRQPPSGLRPPPSVGLAKKKLVACRSPPRLVVCVRQLVVGDPLSTLLVRDA